MNSEDALAATKDVEKIGDKGMKEDNSRGQKRECQDCQTRDRSKRKNEKLLER